MKICKFMIKFCKIIFIFFVLQNFVNADEIREFEVEGLSLGNSLLGFYSKSYIDNLPKTTYPASDKFYQIEIDSKSDDYDNITIILKKNDSKYKIYNIGPGKFFDNDLKACNKLMDQKRIEIKSMLNDFKENTYEHIYNIDDKKSVAYITDFNFSDGSSIRVFCVDWSEVTEKKRNFGDNFTLDLSLNEYLDWINNEAYN